MTRVLCALFLVFASLPAQQKPPVQQEAEPPEEDESLREKEYAFNPIQAEKELKVGNFYFKRGSYKSAAMRYTEATKWNPGYADAWFRLGEAREKMRDPGGAREAYLKFLEVAAEDKRAPALRKKLAIPPPKS